LTSKFRHARSMENLGILVLIKWLFDTNLLSELRKKRVNKNVTIWLATLANEQICSSTMNFAELAYGANVANDELLQVEIKTWIETELRPWLGDRVYPVDEKVLLRWRVISRQREAKQQSAPPVDLMIAAVARENGLFVATRDTKPFVACGVPTFNPWTGERFNGA
jgi:toxin FitB